jgi:hypothetical protein
LPKLSEFFGISVYMYWGDHGPPHFHARYSGEKASIGIDDLSVLAGKLSPRALGLVMEWPHSIRMSFARRGERQ